MPQPLSSIDYASRLTAGARSVQSRAALVVLTSTPFLYDRSDVVGRWYFRVGTGDDAPLAVDWQAAAADARSGDVPMSDGERAVVLLAASIAGAGAVNLASVFRQIDADNAAALMTALAALAGSGEPVGVNMTHYSLHGQADR